MISVKTALQKIKETIQPTHHFEKIDLDLALDKVLFEDVLSEINMPPFRQSAMDGYALNLNASNLYSLKDEVKAGDNKNTELQPGECVRIFTGAPVPDSANAVIMQEKTSVKNNQITTEEPLKENMNIRPIGEQVLKGNVALKKGTPLNPAGIGFLASLGKTEVKVYKQPNVCIVATGNELIQPGQPLQHGEIYESNTIMLKSALLSFGLKTPEIFQVKDNYEDTLQLLDKVSKSYDIVLVSGGISVGDYDFVGKSLNELGVNQVFYKIKQKPGKPLYYGQRESCLIFALPGNPAAALTCLYMYGLPAIKQIQGLANTSSKIISGKSVSNFKKKGDRAQYLKARITNNQVEILEGQSSAMLQTFALANAFVYLEGDETEIKIGDSVKVLQP